MRSKETLWVTIAFLALIATIYLCIEVAEAGDSLIQAILGGITGVITIRCTVAAARESIIAAAIRGAKEEGSKR